MSVVNAQGSPVKSSTLGILESFVLVSDRHARVLVTILVLASASVEAVAVFSLVSHHRNETLVHSLVSHR